MLNRRNLSEYKLALILADLSLVALAWVAAYFLRFYTFMEVPKGIPDFQLYFKVTPFIMLTWLITFQAGGLYRRSMERRSAVREAIDLVQSSALAAIGFLAFTALYDEYRYSRLTLAIFLILSIFCLIAGRSLFRKMLRRHLKGLPPRNAVLIGGGKLFDDLVRRLNEQDSGYRLRAAVILDGRSSPPSAEAVETHEGIPGAWPDFFSVNRPDTVFITLEPETHRLISRELPLIADQVPDIKVVPDVLRLTSLSPRMDSFLGLPAISIHESPLATSGQLVKRCMDFFGALAALTAFAPVMTLLAVFIKLTSKGPVLYRQTRMGLDGRTFEMLKFRSMTVDSETSTGAVFAKKGDARTTSIGKLMRRTSLDELPQFLNVLWGEMSLVGPRPERPFFVDQFRRQIPGYMLRHKVKSGVTGWAQVNGWRGDTSIEKRIEFDLHYIQNWSIRLDCKIIVLTVFKGFIHKNAY